nr:MAG TPA: hypothetical protein [Caudoviricetes sp.]
MSCLILFCNSSTFKASNLYLSSCVNSTELLLLELLFFSNSFTFLNNYNNN